MHIYYFAFHYIQGGKALNTECSKNAFRTHRYSFSWSKHTVLSNKTENDNIRLVFFSSDFHVWKFRNRQTNYITAVSTHNIDKLCLWTCAYNTTHLRSLLWYRITCIIWAFLFCKNNVIFIIRRLFKRLIIASTRDHLCVRVKQRSRSTHMGDVCSLALQRTGFTTTLVLQFCTA